MKQVTCDRCGKDASSEPHPLGFQIDLCTACMDSLLDWMEAAGYWKRPEF